MSQSQINDVIINCFEEQAKLLLSQIDRLKKLSGKHVKNEHSNESGVESDAAPKKKRKRADPAHPHVLSGYQLFMKEEFPHMKADNPTVDPKDRMVLMSKRWQNLGVEDKEKYNHRSQELKEAAKGNESAPAAAPTTTASSSSKPAPVMTSPQKHAPSSSSAAAHKEAESSHHHHRDHESDDPEKRKKKKKKHSEKDHEKDDENNEKKKVRK
jgi:hypothetical protein